MSLEYRSIIDFDHWMVGHILTSITQNGEVEVIWKSEKIPPARSEGYEG
jgi:hypothetical protein